MFICCVLRLCLLIVSGKKEP
uniref:Uncharacterized protein n=1 Tax=Anguilla anguilla TaxID=7936 RepID=A0A0E9VB08_ANGAN